MLMKVISHLNCFGNNHQNSFGTVLRWVLSISGIINNFRLNPLPVIIFPIQQNFCYSNTTVLTVRLQSSGISFPWALVSSKTGSNPDLLNQKLWGMWPRNICLNKLVRWFSCTLQFEEYWTRPLEWGFSLLSVLGEFLGKYQKRFTRVLSGYKLINRFPFWGTACNSQNCNKVYLWTY